MPDQNAIATLQNHIAALAQMQVDLAEQLKFSMLLEAFEPRAFEYGACKVGGVGSVRYAPLDAKFRVVLGNGEVIEHPLLKTPVALWPDTMREEFETIPAHRRPKVGDS